MKSPTFMVRHIRWWNKPLPLLRREKDGHEVVGWVWNQWAYLVNNISMGWVAFVEDQTPENIDIWKCPHCGASIWGSQRYRITEHLKGQQ